RFPACFPPMEGQSQVNSYSILTVTNPRATGKWPSRKFRLDKTESSPLIPLATSQTHFQTSPAAHGRRTTARDSAAPLSKAPSSAPRFRTFAVHKCLEPLHP